MENPLSRFLNRSISCFQTIVFLCPRRFKAARISTILLVAAILVASSASAQVSNATWHGLADTDWNNPLNWSGAAVPSAASNVLVQSAAPFAPAIRSASVTINDLDLQAGKTLDLTGGSITINGVVSGTGIFSVSPASSLTIGGTAGGSAGTIRFSASANTVGTVVLNRTGAGAAVTLGSPLSVSNVFTVVAGTFNTADQLTLRSDANGSARVGTSAGTIAGKVTVEKYIPARRAWRLLCASVAASAAPFINTAWQEGALLSIDNFAPGYGTHITGGPSSKGFDQSPTNSSSLKYMYNNTWTDLANTNATQVTRYPGYLFFLRGNRSYDIGSTLPTTAPLPTVLRTKGPLNQGTLPAVSIAAAGLTLVANPYASPVSFNAVAATGTNLKNRLYMWDPTLGGATGVGGYVVLDWNGDGYTTVPASAMSTYIPAGQAFFVETANGTTTGKVFFNESHKAGSSIAEPLGRTAVSETALLMNLNVFNDDRTTATTDGVLALFNPGYSGDVDKNDALKVNNLSDNLAILTRGKQLTIERRSLPTQADTLTLNISALRRTEYQLEFIPKNFVVTGMIASLYDRYTNTLTALSSTDTSRYNFVVSSNSLSQQVSRFSIVYHKAPTAITSLQGIYRGSSLIDLSWLTLNSKATTQFDIEKKNTTGVFTAIGSVDAVPNEAAGLTAYNYNDAQAMQGVNVYRIKATCAEGQIVYSDTLKLNIRTVKQFSDLASEMPVSVATMPTTKMNKRVASKGMLPFATAGITVFPNPVQGRRLTIQLNGINKGKYQVELTDQAGQTVYHAALNYQASDTHLLDLKQSLSSGVYRLIVKQGMTNYTTNVLITN